MKNTLTLDSNINIIFEKYIHKQTIGWYLEAMAILPNREDISVREWFYQDLDASWKVEVVLSAIRSWLCWLHEYDDIYYIVKENEVYFDRLKIKKEEIE